MASRLWATLLLLAAVFATHGVQCVTSDSAMEHGSPSLAAVPSVVGHPAAVHLADGTEMPRHSDAAAADGGRDAAVTLLPWHDAYVLIVCLAILLAGLTVLGAGAHFRGRAVPPVRGSPGRGHRFAAWSLWPRPPDLSVLCLLRI